MWGREREREREREGGGGEREREILVPANWLLETWKEVLLYIALSHLEGC